MAPHFPQHVLSGSADPIKQIAEEVGYENVYYFTKLFRDRFGLPPGRYRAEAARLARSGTRRGYPNATRGE